MNLQVFQASLSKAVSLTAIAAATLVSLPALAQSTPGSISPSAPTGATPGSVTEPATPSANPVPAAPASVPSGAPTTTDPATSTPATTDPATSAPATTAPATTGQTETGAGTIVDVATSNGSFKTLVAALKAADLTSVLEGEGPYTVFAPTDKAFAALPKGTVETLLKPENKEKLKKVLTYHVLPGKVESATIKGGRIATVEGSSVNLAVRGKNVTVNNAKVTTPDVEASNGVIHAIDRVILPPNL